VPGAQDQGRDAEGAEQQVRAAWLYYAEGLTQAQIARLFVEGVDVAAVAEDALAHERQIAGSVAVGRVVRGACSVGVRQVNETAVTQ